MKLKNGCSNFQIKMLRHSLHSQWYTDELPKRVFQEFDLMLERIPHPANAFYFFELNLSIVIVVSVQEHCSWLEIPRRFSVIRRLPEYASRRDLGIIKIRDIIMARALY